jgi:hypothetical protein
MKKVILIICSFISLNAFSQVESDNYKEDYLQACELISEKYIYLERKLNTTRSEFIKRERHRADSLSWNKETFVSEIRNLRCHFPDGHFSWSINKELSPFDGFYTLGFACTFTNDSCLVVKKTYPHYNTAIEIDDTITHINGTSASLYINELGRRDPQSTPHATLEVAARNLTLVKYFTPTTDSLSEMIFDVKNGPRHGRFICNWIQCGLTSDVVESRENENLILVQRNGYLSIEDVDDNYTSYHPSLWHYSEKIDSLEFSILHIRDFMSWEVWHIDSVIGVINKKAPDFLIIDLKDCAGGSFDNMLYLSHALDLTKPFSFFYDVITEESKRFSGVSDFNFISDSIVLKNKWTGDVVVRTNEIAGSACDFFARHIQANERGVIVGMPPAGRGGGTDGFELSNTKTEISFPLRERIPVEYLKSIESDVMEIDFFSEKEMKRLLRDLIIELEITPHRTFYN